MPRQKTQSGVSGVVRLAEMLSKGPARGRGRQSPLTRWLEAHHDEFAAMLVDKQPSWEAVAAGLAAMGVRDGAHKPPTAERVRKAWWFARQHVAAKQSGRPETPVIVQVVPDALSLVSAAHGTPPAGSEVMQSSRTRPRLDIRPATPLGSGSPTAPVGLPLPPAVFVPDAADAASGDRDVAAQIDRLREQMESGKVRLPKVVP